ncbi:helix-turn-helix domain-containing protein [Rickettsiaceae bacterium]|nr:helix-turn-helix domain-containing protein [Rickettsiaceae bacterium]
MTILEYMNYEHLTLTELARRLDITPTKLSQYAYGTTKPRQPMAFEIGVVTEGMVTADDIFGTTRKQIEAEMKRRGKPVWK